VSFLFPWEVPPKSVASSAAGILLFNLHRVLVGPRGERELLRSGSSGTPRYPCSIPSNVVAREIELLPQLLCPFFPINFLPALCENRQASPPDWDFAALGPHSFVFNVQFSPLCVIRPALPRLSLDYMAPSSELCLDLQLGSFPVFLRFSFPHFFLFPFFSGGSVPEQKPPGIKVDVAMLLSSLSCFLRSTLCSLQLFQLRFFRRLKVRVAYK